MTTRHRIPVIRQTTAVAVSDCNTGHANPSGDMAGVCCKVSDEESRPMARLTDGVKVDPSRFGGRPSTEPGQAQAMADLKQRSPFYLLMAVSMSCTVFTGFSFTYFGPLLRGVYPEVSPLVHVHGWTFFLWYLLLPLQAGLIRSRNVAVHRGLGLASIVLGALMILVGLIVSVVQIHLAQKPDADPFWQLMGVPIFWIWVLFTVFYIEAIRRRRRFEEHKRLILLASAVPISAASFRILVQFVEFGTGVTVVGCLLPVLFPLVAMFHDRRRSLAAHPVYLWGIPAMVVIIGGSFLIGLAPGGELAEQGLAWLGGALMPLYSA